MRKRSSSFREKISDTINETLRRKKKQKSRTEPLEFLYVNRPDFSSEESLCVQEKEKSELAQVVKVWSCKFYGCWPH